MKSFMFGCIITAIVLVWLDCGKIMEKQDTIISNQKEIIKLIKTCHPGHKKIYPHMISK